MYVYELCKAFCEDFKLDFDVLLGGRSRKREYAEGRSAIWCYLHDVQGYSFPHLGRMFNRDHSTICYAMRAIEEADNPKKDRMAPYFSWLQVRGEELLEKVGRESLRSRFYRMSADSDRVVSAKERSLERVRVVFSERTHSISRQDRHYASTGTLAGFSAVPVPITDPRK